MNAKSGQRVREEADWRHRSQSQPEVPIRREPQAFVQPAGFNDCFATEYRRRNRDEVLNQKAFDEFIRRNQAVGKWTRPIADLLSIWIHEDRVVQHEEAGGVPHLGAERSHASGEPEIILMEE